jgi:hypothetical protein
MVITGADTGNLVVTVRENPVINRIVLEGNKRIKNDKILPEIKLAPRQIYTRSKVRADVDRIIELYRRQGRFAATVEPKIVQLDQNRVDLVFEITEGDKSKVRAINIIGNEEYSDGRLRKEMFNIRKPAASWASLSPTTVTTLIGFLGDQQKLRLLSDGGPWYSRGFRRLPSSPPIGGTSSSPMWSRKALATNSVRSTPRAKSGISTPTSSSRSSRSSRAAGSTPSWLKTR